MSKRKKKVRRPAGPAPQRYAGSVARGGSAGDPRVEEALRLHKDEHHAAAETLLRNVLAEAPRHVRAMRLLGHVLHAQNRHLDAAELFQGALGLEGENAAGLAELGAALVSAGRAEAGAQAYFRATQLDDTHLLAHVNLGNLLFKDGHIDAAERLFLRAIEIDPKCTQALLALAQVHELRGKLAEAESIYEHVLELEPDGFQARFGLATVHKRAGKLQKAIEAYTVILREHPDCFEASTNLGTCYTDLGLAEEAVETYDDALARNPDLTNAQFFNNRAYALALTGQFDRAFEDYRRSMNLDPGYLGALSNYLLDCHYADEVGREEMWRIFRRFNAVVEERAARDVAPPPPARDPEKRLRVGFVSPDFRNHPVAVFLLALFEERDRDRFAFHCYSNTKRRDAWTERFRDLADGWRDCVGQEDPTIARWIREDGVDILVDLAGHTGDNRLSVFVLRPAPLQITWLGYPDTTGLDAMDYRLTDAFADPPGEADCTHSETLVRLPGGFHCFVPDEDTPDPAPPPVEENGYVTFGSFNKFAKHSASCLAAWARILTAVPEARLFIKSRELANPAVAERLRETFRGHGVDPERIDLQTTVPKKSDHFALYGRVDLALDTFPYNGTTTTCEALYMGAPVLTVAGEMHAGRVGVSLLHHVGLDELIAPSVDDYVDLAVALAREPQRLAELRSGMRERLMRSPIADRTGFVAKWQDTVRDLWRERCERDRERSGAASQPSTPPELFTRPGRPPIRILHNLARAGGTLVSRCLGCMAGVALLSEIHPLGIDWFNPLEQAGLWHDLLTAEDRQTLRQRRTASFDEGIALIEARAHQRGLALLLRDWAHLDYMGRPFLDRPTHRPGLADALAERFTPVRFALVRHPLDQWLSLEKLTLVRGRLDPDAYLLGCRRFAEMAAEVGFLRYEDFTRDPAAGMKAMCEALDLPYDESFLERWADYACVTGDTAGGSRAGRDRTIRALPRKEVPPGVRERFEANNDYCATLDILGYSP